MSNRQLMGRRDFLIVSSTCALATAAIGPRLFAAEGAPAPRRLAVGYATFDKDVAVTAAANVPAGDGGFIGRGARIVVSGVSGASGDPRQRRVVELLAHYSYFEGAERQQAPFRAWSGSRLTGGQGSPVRFTVPVDDVQRISFTVSAETGAPVASKSTVDAVFNGNTEVTTLPMTLSIRNVPDAFKLARGYYILVPVFEDESEPNWSAWKVAPLNGRRSLVDDSGTSASFEHFVLKVDYAAV